MTITNAAVLRIAKTLLADTPESANRDAATKLIDLVIEADRPLSIPKAPYYPFPSGPPRYISPPVMAGGFGQTLDESLGSVSTDDITVNADGTWTSSDPDENAMLLELGAIMRAIQSMEGDR